MSSNILILGAGELGTAILTALSFRAPPSTKITVLLRPSTTSSPSPSKKKELDNLSSLGISFLPGDVAKDSISTLANLLKPYDLVISSLGFASGPGSQIKITRAVLDAGVKRYIPWQFGVDYDIVGRGSAQPVWDEQLDVRDMLRAQNSTEWIVVSTGIFMSFLFQTFFGVVENSEKEGEVIVRALGGWENKVTVTMPKDIGRLTSEVVFFEPRVIDEVVFTAGETISYRRVAEIVDEVLGKKVKREIWSVPYLEEELKEDPENLVLKYRVVFGVGKGVSWDADKTFNVRNGIEVQDVKRYAMENLPKTLTGSVIT